ncbi:MAG: hypothetical protein C4320_08445 [Armatimonadota bacterium]
MKRVVAMTSVATLAGCLALLNAGCGGGGTPDPGVDISRLSNVRIDAVLSSGQVVDPGGIFPGETVRFRLTGINDAGVRVFANVSGFTGAVPSGVGTLFTNGTFVARNPGGPFPISVTVGGTRYTTDVQVRAVQAIVTGRIRSVNGLPASRIIIRAYNSSGVEVGSGASATDGTFRLSLPTSAVRFSLDFSAVDPNARSYVRQFSFSGMDYSTQVVGCTARLPALTNGVQTTLSSDVVVYLLNVNAPPPPPDGCNLN